MTIPWSWIFAGLAFLLAGVLALVLWYTRRRRQPRTLADAAKELAEKQRADARRIARADEAAAEAEGARMVAEADAKAEEEVSRGTSGGLASHLRRLNRDAD